MTRQAFSVFYKALILSAFWEINIEDLLLCKEMRPMQHFI